MLQGQELEDIMMEAKKLWLEAALRCDFSKASLTTFGLMYLRQRLSKYVLPFPLAFQQLATSLQTRHP